MTEATTSATEMPEPGVLTEHVRDSRQETNASKFLSFALADEPHAVPLLMVREILSMLEIRPLPHTPAYVRGVINLRGKVIPVIDMRLKFGMHVGEDTKRTCIVVVQEDIDDESRLAGLVVDRVDEVIDIPPESLEPPPISATSGLSGVGRFHDQVVLIVDLVGLIPSVL